MLTAPRGARSESSRGRCLTFTNGSTTAIGGDTCRLGSRRDAKHKQENRCVGRLEAPRTHSIRLSRAFNRLASPGLGPSRFLASDDAVFG